MRVYSSWDNVITEEIQIANKSAKQMHLLNVAIRISLTTTIFVFSSFLWETLSLIILEIEGWSIYLFTYSWSLDSIINLICIYLSMSMAADHYKRICFDICKCHPCYLQFMIKVVDWQIHYQ